MTAPAEVALYRAEFDALADVAALGRGARELITAALAGIEDPAG